MSWPALSEGVREFGRHFLIGLQKSPVLTDHDRWLLEQLQPAGVVLFRDNFRHDLPYDEWLGFHAEQIAAVRALVDRPGVVVAIDHEGGRVLRTPLPITDFGEPADWAGRAGEVGTAMGRELASLGVNVNFAPLADLHSNPANPVIGRRAFGAEREAVVAAARAFLRAQQEAGVLGCLKHFPGHGDTALDSHLELPTVDVPLELLRRRELAPFRALLDEHVELVMTAHILFPQWDPSWPATLSRTILDGELRRAAGYDGVVISDDVGMAAVAELFDRPEVPALALTAGCDLIAICAHLTDTGRAAAMAAALDSSLASGELAPSTVERSRRRLGRFLDALPVHPVVALEEEVLAGHRRIARPE